MNRQTIIGIIALTTMVLPAYTAMQDAEPRGPLDDLAQCLGIDVEISLPEPVSAITTDPRGYHLVAQYNQKLKAYGLFKPLPSNEEIPGFRYLMWGYTSQASTCTPNDPGDAADLSEFLDTLRDLMAENGVEPGVYPTLDRADP